VSRAGWLRRDRACGLAAALLASGAAGLAQAAARASTRCAPRTGPSDLPLLDRHGTPLQTLRVDAGAPLPWVPLADMSPALLQAIVLSEDRRFWEHGGVDWRRAGRSAWANAWNTRTRGASTLTMQLAGLLDEDLARPAGGRSVAQKLGQMAARSGWSALEQGADPRGLPEPRAAARRAGGHRRAGADAVRQAPQRAGRARGRDRRRAGARAQRRPPPWWSAAPARAAAAAAGCPAWPPPPRRPCVRPAACRWASSWRRTCRAPALRPRRARRCPPLRLRSTLDARLQRLAMAALRQQLAELRGRKVEDGAVLVLDNASGEVLAWVGSAGGCRPRPRWTRAGAPPARLHAQALRLRPGLRAAPAHAGQPAGRRAAADRHRRRLYLPQNYDRRFRGWVSARRRWRQPERAGRARGHAMLPPDALFSASTRPACPAQTAGYLRPRAGAGQRRRHAAGAGQRLPRAGQRRVCSAPVRGCCTPGGRPRAPPARCWTPPWPSW
jgi:penicillin-binding protein 1C